MDVKVKMYDKVKYEKDSVKTCEVEYKNINGFEVVTGDRATDIGLQTDENSRDDYNEYLVITFADGSEATFRNSYCDMFVL